jgi:CRISPR-associated endonuclease Cas2
VLLRELRQRQQTRRELSALFEMTIGRLLPVQKVSVTAGYTESSFQRKSQIADQLRFNQLLYELKRDKLVSGTAGSNAILKITSQGLRWLKNLKNTSLFSLPTYTEPATKSPRLTILSYDIPEKSSLIRDWLRKNLTNLGMRAIQRSVFIGKIKLPAPLLQTIVELKLDDCVEIFEVTRTGTLQRRIF